MKRLLAIVALAACGGVPSGGSIGLEVSVEPLEGNCSQIVSDRFVVAGDCDEHDDVIMCRHRQGTIMLFDFDTEIVSQSIPEPRTDGDWSWCINRFRMVD